MHQDIKSEDYKMGILREFGLDDFYDETKLVDTHKDISIIRGVTMSKNIPIQFLRPTGLIGQGRGLVSEDWISHNNIFVGAGALTPIIGSARGMGGAVGTLGPQKVKTNIVADPFPKTPIITGKGIASKITSTPAKVFTTPPPRATVPNPTKPPIPPAFITGVTAGTILGKTANITNTPSRFTTLSLQGERGGKPDNTWAGRPREWVRDPVSGKSMGMTYPTSAYLPLSPVDKSTIIPGRNITYQQQKMSELGFKEYTPKITSILGMSPAQYYPKTGVVITPSGKGYSVGSDIRAAEKYTQELNSR
jgi:hypothetical protein